MKDHRVNKRNQVHHPLNEILFLTISAVVSGFEQWTDIEFFGNEKIDWLRQYFDYKNGIPSHDTLGRVFARLDTKQFGECFMNWTASLHQITKGKVVAIDGKTMRGSYDKFHGKAAVHMVSAYATEQELSLGQVATDQKSNEITAIPQLLNLLTLEGCTVSIDAMGCQKEIASKIIACKADYILGVKENQKSLLEQIEKVFRIQKPSDQCTTKEKSHQRYEQRTCSVIDDLRFLDSKQWENLSSVIRIESLRIVNDKTETATRYYISSKKAFAEQFNQEIRSHWAIENKLHWVLDVTFKEDKSRKRKGDSAHNFSYITKAALTIVDKHKGKGYRPAVRTKAILNDRYRSEILEI